MADSLRDQLIAAGFDAPKKEVRKKPKPGATKNSANSGAKKRQGNKPPVKAQGKAHSKTQGKPQGQQQGKHQGQGKPQGERTKGSPQKRGPGGKGQPQKAQVSDSVIEERKRLKAKIKILIDENKTEPWKGETVYRYLVDKKIRELYVADELHPKLAERVVAITRFNGETFIVPRDIGQAIKEINPQWSVFNLEDEETTSAGEKLDSEYADFQVPDDLQW